MRIAVDARQVFRPGRRGIGKTLIDLYQTLADRRPDWHFVLVHQTPADVPGLTGRSNVTRRQIDFSGLDRFDLWERVVLPAAAAAVRADVLHCPAHTAPRNSPAPVVLNVHDLIPAETTPNDPRAARWLRRVAASARRARRVLTGSEYSRRRVADGLGVPANKVTVVPWAPARDSRRVADAFELDRVRAAHGLRPGEPYVFGFGAADPRKNTRRVIEAYARLPAGVRAEFRLLLVGIQAESLAGFRRLAADLGVGDRAVLCGFTDEEYVPVLLSGAAALCFPSLNEGFGLPLLDAFACRTPVLAGDRTSLPEVAGGAALLVDPESTDAIRDGLRRLLTDHALRDGLISRGAERVKLFNWDNVADAVARVFEEAAGRPVPSGGGV